MKKPKCKSCEYYVYKELPHERKGYFCRDGFTPYAKKWGSCIDDCKHNDELDKQGTQSKT